MAELSLKNKKIQSFKVLHFQTDFKNRFSFQKPIFAWLQSDRSLVRKPRFQLVVFMGGFEWQVWLISLIDRTIMASRFETIRLRSREIRIPFMSSFSKENDFCQSIDAIDNDELSENDWNSDIEYNSRDEYDPDDSADRNYYPEGSPRSSPRASPRSSSSRKVSKSRKASASTSLKSSSEVHPQLKSSASSSNRPPRQQQSSSSSSNQVTTCSLNSK